MFASDHIHDPVYATVYTDTSADIQRSDSPGSRISVLIEGLDELRVPVKLSDGWKPDAGVMNARTGNAHCMYELDGYDKDLTIPRREATIQQK
ncbi:uncharacterized protein PHALS_08668 [Plasmopara halstedii]|uniref:Uncharacterized protein n=1 Tax=Plasmopara halstedii TaxID=4781 RepID=A0A0P1ACI5_PLAHL|nr:uncharacterized protein PHALS_08668 [Plasmopara halstedii]CEG38605.1 hypothetical protein PHALS_08668 [Plasmopara halstedii]|eukprot:XP_024574974.1 hypothetical protein PHALS_08668 [Plasmopara halstedii]